jgi:NADH:ubiquinone oxidoreductase subunit C
LNSVSNTSNNSFKLFFEYILFNINHLYLTHKIHGFKNITVLIPQNVLYYTAVHMRFASILYSSQLVDMFSYELPLSNSQNKLDDSQPLPFTQNSIVVYNFHNLTSQERFFFFCVESFTKYTNFSLNSIAELYPNANWLEREVSELSGNVFNNKKDLRNLMLQYGDTSVPFQKSYPSIGLKEVFFDSINDLIVQAPVTIQV